MTTKGTLGAIALAGALLASLPASAEAVKVDKSIKDYKKTDGVSGNLNSIGSDTLNNLMTLWAETFQKQYPSVKIQIEGKGLLDRPSGTDFRDGAARSHEPPHEARGNRRLREAVRLQADGHPRRGGRPRRVRTGLPPANSLRSRHLTT